MNTYTARKVTFWGGDTAWWIARNGYAFITNQFSAIDLTQAQAEAIASALNAVEAAPEAVA